MHCITELCYIKVQSKVVVERCSLLSLPVHLFWAVPLHCSTRTDSHSLGPGVEMPFFSPNVKWWLAKPERKNKNFLAGDHLHSSCVKGSKTASVSVPLSEQQRVPSEGKLSRCWPRTLGRGFLFVRHPAILAKPCSGAGTPSMITTHKGWSTLSFHIFFTLQRQFVPSWTELNSAVKTEENPNNTSHWPSCFVTVLYGTIN